MVLLIDTLLLCAIYRTLEFVSTFMYSWFADISWLLLQHVTIRRRLAQA